ncbi:MAG: adenylyltransferase/cytidyltransferase family protein [Candidatus Liptonbacteria bacterium]|nr:adenylyltransferase/cytidyltransferase family protein [Candidatus Liptonbacteria bacterium]
MKKAKVRSLGEIAKIAKRAKDKGLKVVTTNGCFDLIHVGHIRNLERARSLGDVLIVGINSDSSVKKLKGKNRPIITAIERAEVIGSLSSVDYVFIFADLAPTRWLAKVKPDVHVKGGDRKIHEIPERHLLKKIGAKLIFLPIRKGRSTSALIEKIKKYA